MTHEEMCAQLKMFIHWWYLTSPEKEAQWFKDHSKLFQEKHSKEKLEMVYEYYRMLHANGVKRDENEDS